MKIAVIGAGAMDSIYGGRLSLHNDVCLIDTNAEVVGWLNENGLRLEENGEDVLFRPKAMTDSSSFGRADLVILFVKALFSRAALSSNCRMDQVMRISWENLPIRSISLSERQRIREPFWGWGISVMAAWAIPIWACWCRITRESWKP